MDDVASIRSKFEALRPFLDERRRRLWAAAEAIVLGHGGSTAVATATGLRRNTIRAGIRELQTSRSRSAAGSAATGEERRIRAPGGGRKPLTTHDPALPRARSRHASVVRWSVTLDPAQRLLPATWPSVTQPSTTLTVLALARAQGVRTYADCSDKDPDRLSADRWYAVRVWALSRPYWSQQEAVSGPGVKNCISRQPPK